MPYIANYNDRAKLNDLVKQFQKHFGINFTGSLNYFIYKLAKESCGRYADYRDFIGELESAKLEIYRCLVSKYEDDAIIRNGDVE